MPDLVRMSLAMERPLLDQFERAAREARYANRSEFVRDMVRDHLAKRQWTRNEEVLGTITLVYNHHFRQLNEKLTDLQHDFHDCVLAATHVHLDEDICAEMILVKGRARKIEEIANLLRQQKGVLHASLSMSSTGKRLT
jgi:CopG family nickel-responsive transcriptional regulator